MNITNDYVNDFALEPPVREKHLLRAIIQRAKSSFHDAGLARSVSSKHSDTEQPMKLIFDTPMAANILAKTFCLHVQVAEIKRGWVSCCLASLDAHSIITNDQMSAQSFLDSNKTVSLVEMTCQCVVLS